MNIRLLPMDNMDLGLNTLSGQIIILAEEVVRVRELAATVTTAGVIATMAAAVITLT